MATIRFSGKNEVHSLEISTGSQPSARRVTRGFYDKWVANGQPVISFESEHSTGFRTLVKRNGRYYTRRT